MVAVKSILRFLVALMVIGIGVLIWYSIQPEPSLPLYGGDQCCWNNPLESCSSDADCDIGGQGCMKTGSWDVNAGVIECRTCKSQGLPYNAVTRKCESTGKCCTEWENQSCNTDRDCEVGGCNLCVAGAGAASTIE